MITADELAYVQEAIDELLDSCYGLECMELAQSLEDALLAIAKYRKECRARHHAKLLACNRDDATGLST